MNDQGWYEVGTHGPPDPDEHPWVWVKFSGTERWITGEVRPDGTIQWASNAITSLALGDRWFPVSASPTEPAHRPEKRWMRSWED